MPIATHAFNYRSTSTPPTNHGNNLSGTPSNPFQRLGQLERVRLVTPQSQEAGVVCAGVVAFFCLRVLPANVTSVLLPETVL